jgi:hypothetical protein
VLPAGRVDRPGMGGRCTQSTGAGRGLTAPSPPDLATQRVAGGLRVTAGHESPPVTQQPEGQAEADS